ncbi:hypothetical protein DESC_40116 [Desulfosarcina cetonica]|nr:hypothetical protein DESC_40116 [Desulfosarcina cetonica]
MDGKGTWGVMFFECWLDWGCVLERRVRSVQGLYVATSLAGWPTLHGSKIVLDFGPQGVFDIPIPSACHPTQRGHRRKTDNCPLCWLDLWVR